MKKTNVNPITASKAALAAACEKITASHYSDAEALYTAAAILAQGTLKALEAWGDPCPKIPLARYAIMEYMRARQRGAAEEEKIVKRVERAGIDLLEEAKTQCILATDLTPESLASIKTALRQYCRTQLHISTPNTKGGEKSEESYEAWAEKNGDTVGREDPALEAIIEGVELRLGRPCKAELLDAFCEDVGIVKDGVEYKYLQRQSEEYLSAAEYSKAWGERGVNTVKGMKTRIKAKATKKGYTPENTIEKLYTIIKEKKNKK